MALISFHMGYKSKYEKVGVLSIRIVKSNVPSSERKRMFSLWRRVNVRNIRSDSNARNVRLYLSVLAVHRPFYISICISTLPTQHTTFILILYVLAVHEPFHISICIPYGMILGPFIREKINRDLFKTRTDSYKRSISNKLRYGPAGYV